MKVLITGATGLIGTELVSLLLKKNISIHYLTTSKKKIQDQPNYKGFYWNPNQGIVDISCFDNVDVIVHLAGATIAKRWTSQYKQEIIESRILSANTLFKALKENTNQVKQIVSASGTAIYPNSSSKIYSEESTDFDQGFLGNVVAKWEESVDKFELLNIKVCKLRTGIVLSNRGGALLEMLKPIKIGLGSSFGNGKQIQSWIHVYDLVSIYLFAIQNSLEGIYNAVSPNPISNEKLTQSIAETLKKPFFMPNVPKFLMKIILGEMYELLFTDKNLSAQKVINKGFVFQFPFIDKALKNILK